MSKGIAKIFCVIGVVSLPVLGFADSDTSEKTPNNFNFSGYIDGSYNDLQSNNQFVSRVNDRVFDIEPNGFTLQQLAVTFSNQPKEGFGGLLNIIAGRDAFGLASYGWNPGVGGSRTFGIDPTQAFGQYATKHFTFMAGKFVTIAGSEVLDYPLDTNFSRSILFGYAAPFTLTGFRGVYTVNDKLKFTAGVNNGWDNVTDTRRGATLELGTSYVFNTIFSASVQGYTGDERATPATSSGPIGTRSLVDFVGTANATEKLSFITNYDYAWQTVAALPNGTNGRAVWTGVALHTNYKFNKKWQTSLRGEVFDDQNGFRTGVRQTWDEATFSVGYSPIERLLLRAETRRDFSNVNAFLNSNGTIVKNNQQSFALEGLYTF